MNLSVIVFICFWFCLVIKIEYKFVIKSFIFWYVIKLGLLNVSFSGISSPPAGIGDGWYCVGYAKPSNFLLSSFKKKNMCLEISLDTCPTVFSRGGLSTIALIAQQYVLHYRFHCLCFISFPSVHTSFFMFHLISFSPHFIVHVSF